MRRSGVPSLVQVPLDRLGGENVGRLKLAAAAAHQRAWLVGGAVRDLLLGRDVGDLDVVVEGDAEQVARRLPVEVVSRSQFMTLIVRWPDGQLWDLVTARTEAYAGMAALPTVQPATIHDDLLRRDFTIHALAADLGEGGWGQVLDPAHGLADLAASRLRVLHEWSYVDDPTRMFRQVRYEAKLGFHMAPRTREAWRVAFSTGSPHKVTGDRIKAELEKTLQATDAIAAIQRLHSSGLLSVLGPRWTAPHAAARLLAEMLSEWQAARLPVPADLWLAWLGTALPVLSAANCAETVSAVSRRLGLSAAQRQVLEAAGTWQRGPSPSHEPRAALVHRLDRYSGAALLVTCSRSAKRRDDMVRYLREWRDLRPTLRGEDLASMGCRRGPEMGRILGSLRDARIEGTVASDLEERALAARLIATGTTKGHV